MIKVKQDQQGMIGFMEIALIVVVIAMIGVVVWRVNDASVDVNTQQASLDDSSSEEVVETLPDSIDGVLPLEDIQTLALTDNDSLTITGIEFKNEDGVLLYIVHLSDGSVVAYNALTGAVAAYDDDDDDMNENESLPANFVAKVSIDEAIRIAKEQHPNSAVEKVEIEVEDGVVVISVRFVDDSRVDINATSGAVERVKTDDSDERSSDRSSDDDDDSNKNDDSNDDSSNDDNDSDSDDSGSDDSGSDSDDDEDDDNSGSGSNSGRN